MRQVAGLLFDHVLSSWGGLLTELLGQLPVALAAGPGQQPPAALLLAFERWLLLLKVRPARWRAAAQAVHPGCSLPPAATRTRCAAAAVLLMLLPPAGC